MLFSKLRLFAHHYEIPDLMKYLYKYKEDESQHRSTSSSWKAKVLHEMSDCSWDGCVRIIDKRTKSFKSVVLMAEVPTCRKFYFNGVLSLILDLLIIYCVIMEIPDSLYTSQKMHIVLFVAVFLQGSLKYRQFLMMYWVVPMNLLSTFSDPL